MFADSELVGVFEDTERQQQQQSYGIQHFGIDDLISSDSGQRGQMQQSGAHSDIQTLGQSQSFGQQPMQYEVQRSPQHVSPLSPLQLNQNLPTVNEDHTQQKLTIDTSLASASNFQQSLASGLLSSAAIQSAKFQSPPSWRRRNTYNAGDSGPHFTPTQQHETVYSGDKSQMMKFSLTAKLDKGFFLADNDWTCYRRNYFQLSAAFQSFASSAVAGENSSMFQCPVEEQNAVIVQGGQTKRITSFKIGVSSRVAASQKSIQLIQHTSKRDKGPQKVPGPRICRSGGQLISLSPLHGASEAISCGDDVVCFERIQFKSSTANNGKRRTAQQYFVLDICLFAELQDGSDVRIASTTSAPLIVRGRSPGHYADQGNFVQPSYGKSLISPSMQSQFLYANADSMLTQMTPQTPFVNQLLSLQEIPSYQSPSPSGLVRSSSSKSDFDNLMTGQQQSLLPVSNFGFQFNVDQQQYDQQLQLAQLNSVL
ncbi:hypothetical protein MIR68_012032 [Amoeboaphelidium protococcarum]|nr:hypothetical protein MIR68_012032 [Amoeboaphelidium protococcarum]